MTSLTASQVKALLIVASEDSRPAEATDVDAIEVNRTIARMTAANGPAEATLFESVVRDATPVEELTRIKELAKALIAQADDVAGREAARLLYHAAVAAALVHHDARISGRTVEKQQDLYRAYADKWDSHPLGALFRSAASWDSRV
jgi:hypothetical protein